MQQTEKHRTQKYASGNSPSWSKYQVDVRDSSDTHWKYLQKQNLTCPSNKPNRRQVGGSAEAPSNYHIPVNSYKQQRHHNCPIPSHGKYATLPTAEAHRWTPQSQTRPPRNKLYTTNNPSSNSSNNNNKSNSNNCNNVAVVRRTAYKNELEDDENLRYPDEELGNFTEDNVDEEAAEEVEDDPETAASLDKDYEEQEADDEIDEESDSPVQLRSQKLQRRLKKDANSQEQQRSRVNKQHQQHQQQQQDPRKLRYQEYVRNSYECHPLRRRYYQDLEDREVTEIYSEEEPVRPPTPPKTSMRRSTTNYHQHWAPIRSSLDRYDGIPSFSQPNRRNRTRPEVEALLHTDNVNQKKCIRCGAPSASKISTAGKKNNCRFQENPNFLGKETIGEEIDAVEKMLCGRCNVRHDTEEAGVSYGFSRSSGVQNLKPRRSKGSKGIYETSEEGQMIPDEIPNDYATSRYSRDSVNTVHDRTRHSAPTTRGPIRLSSRYA